MQLRLATLPTDLLILRPFSSTQKPWVMTSVVRVHSARQPEVCDKFCVRAAQRVGFRSRQSRFWSAEPSRTPSALPWSSFLAGVPVPERAALRDESASQPHERPCRHADQPSLASPKAHITKCLQNLTSNRAWNQHKHPLLMFQAPGSGSLEKACKFTFACMAPVCRRD